MQLNKHQEIKDMCYEVEDARQMENVLNEMNPGVVVRVIVMNNYTDHLNHKYPERCGGCSIVYLDSICSSCILIM